MATKTAKASGKASQAATWSPEETIKAGDDLIVPSPYVVEWNSTKTPRSLNVEKAAGLSGSTTLVFEASTQAPSNIILKLHPEATVTFTGGFSFNCTYTAEEQQLWLGGHALPGVFGVASTSTAKYRFEEGFSLTGQPLSLNGTGGYKTLGHTIEAPGIEWTAGTLDITNSRIVITGSGGWNTSSSGALTSTGSTIELTHTEGEATFVGDGKTYNIVALSKNTTVTGANTISEVKDNSKGAAEGKGVRFAAGKLQTVTMITTNGTEAEPARLESTEAGKPAELKLPEQETTGYLKLKDITVLTGPWYLPHGTNEGDNATVGTTVKFETREAPSFSGTAAIRSSMAMSIAGSKTSSGTARTAAAPRLLAAAAKAASGTATLPTAMKTTPAGAKASAGQPHIVAGAAQAASGQKVGIGEGQLRGTVRTVAAGVKSTAGQALMRIGQNLLAASSEPAFGGTATLRSGMRTLTTGAKGANGEGRVPAGSHQTTASAKGTTGEARLPVASRQTVTGAPKLVAGTATIRDAVRVAGAGVKHTIGEALIRAAIRLLGREEAPAPTPLEIVYTVAGDRVVTPTVTGTMLAHPSATGDRLAVPSVIGDS